MMNRRDFLRTAALASLAWGCRGAAEGPGARRGTVLVIGAGMAGIAAARDLQSRGFRVTVLEGRDRVGGRMWTDRSLGSPVDMGAAWIEGDRGNPVAALAREFGIATRVSDGDDLTVFDSDGREVPDRILDDLESVLHELTERSHSLGRDVSIEEGMRELLKGETLSEQEERAVRWGLSLISLELAEDPHQLSMRHMDSDEGFPGEDLLVTGGYGELARKLAEGLDVRLGRRVHRIVCDETGVRAETAEDAFEADFAVVAVPLGVLRSGMVGFEPALPEAKRAAIARLGVGVVDKVALKYPRAFWGGAEAFGHFGDFPEFLNLHRCTGAPVLVGFVSGDFARSLEPKTDLECAGPAHAAVRRMFGSSAPDPVGVVVSRWGLDPMTMGSYSHVRVGGTPADYDAVAEPAGRIHFAGEATHRSYPATVHGAFLSGVREAELISRRKP
jgi:monoamine oxidase